MLGGLGHLEIGLDLISRPRTGSTRNSSLGPTETDHRGEIGTPTISSCFCLWIINVHQCLKGKPALNPLLGFNLPTKMNCFDFMAFFTLDWPVSIGSQPLKHCFSTAETSCSLLRKYLIPPEQQSLIQAGPVGHSYVGVLA